jgi:hypothetical protein
MGGSDRTLPKHHADLKKRTDPTVQARSRTDAADRRDAGDRLLR